MKNMGLSRLGLVNPCDYQVYDCYARASGAVDIVDNAVVYDDLQSAVADSSLVIGTSARLRSLAWPQMTPKESALAISDHSPQGRVSVVFGRERSGLTNDELGFCSSLLNIPTSPNFGSLNVAAAVQVVAYEIFCVADNGNRVNVKDVELPAEQIYLEQFYAHFFKVLERVGYFDPTKPKQLPLRVRRLFNRAQVRHSELQVLRGFLAAVEKSISE